MTVSDFISKYISRAPGYNDCVADRKLDRLPAPGTHAVSGAFRVPLED